MAEWDKAAHSWVSFSLSSVGGPVRRSSLVVASLLFLLSESSPRTAADQPPLHGVRRVVFLGDSITYAGQYVAYLEAFLRLKDPEFVCEFLDFGLPSETVSGLTEPGLAGGQFPRPVLHERLSRVCNDTGSTRDSSRSP